MRGNWACRQDTPKQLTLILLLHCNMKNAVADSKDMPSRQRFGSMLEIADATTMVIKSMLVARPVDRLVGRLLWHLIIVPLLAMLGQVLNELPIISVRVVEVDSLTKGVCVRRC